jgi:hypothetical protein
VTSRRDAGHDRPGAGAYSTPTSERSSDGPAADVNDLAHVRPLEAPHHLAVAQDESVRIG